MTKKIEGKRETDMKLKNVIENLVMLVPEAGKKLVHYDGKVVASNVVYVKEESMASAWAELGIEEADALEKQWQLEEEEKQRQEAEAQKESMDVIEEDIDSQEALDE